MINPTKEQVKEFEDLYPLINSFYSEIKYLSAKKSDEALSKTKINMINKVLSKAFNLLKEHSISQYLSILEEEDLPRYSDTLIILSQYQTAMSRFRDMFKPILKDDPFGFEADWQTRD